MVATSNGRGDGRITVLGGSWRSVGGSGWLYGFRCLISLLLPVVDVEGEGRGCSSRSEACLGGA